MDSTLLTDYQEFVDEVSSDSTKNIEGSFSDALEILEETSGVEPSAIVTSILTFSSVSKES